MSTSLAVQNMIAPAVNEIAYVHHPLFERPDANRLIEAIPRDAFDTGEKTDSHPLFSAALLSASEEQYRFLRMNYLRYRAKHTDNPSARRKLLAEALSIRNQIVESNLRLVVSIGRELSDREFTSEELVSEGCLPLIRAVELFDVSRGLRFSTYATNAVRNHFLRVRMVESRDSRRYMNSDPTALDRQFVGVNSGTAASENENAATTNKLLSRLDQRERSIVQARFGFRSDGETRSFSQLGKFLGLSKERARVLTNRALEKLREHAW